jgi:hypothetical protein
LRAVTGAAAASSPADAGADRLWRILRTARGQSIVALALYLAFMLVVIGRGVLAHPSTKVVGDNGPDKTIYIWSLKWWPWAVAHGHDPFHAYVIWSPHGVNLAWVTAVPGAALLALPFTELGNPVLAYNVLVLLALPVAAWCAFLLARRLSGDWRAALVGGYLFGFSSYMLGHAVGHLNLLLVFPVPLAALLLHERFSGDIGRRRFVIGLAAVVVAQFLFSTEITLTMTLLGLLLLGLARWRLPAQDRERLFTTAREAVVAYVVAGVVVSPYLVNALTSNNGPPPRHPELAAADALNYVTSTRRIWLRLPHSEAVREHFTSNGAEQGAYIALPFLLIFLFFLWRKPRAPRRTILILAAIVVALCSLGPEIRVDGKNAGRGPWALVWREPLLRNLLPIRLTMYVALLVGLVVALWLAERPQLWRYSLALLGIVLMLPNPAQRKWAAEIRQSSFFASGDFRHYLHPRDVALVTPYGPVGWSMYWQAESDFGYRMVGGHVGYHIIKSERKWYAVYRSFSGVDLPGGPPRLRSFLRAHHVKYVVVGPRTNPKIEREIAAAVPVAPQRVDDVRLYAVR